MNRSVFAGLNHSCIVQLRRAKEIAMMKQLPAFKVLAALTLLGTATQANAYSLPNYAPQKSSLFVAAAADCAAEGQRVADSQGGTLTKATPAVQNGRNVCVVVVLVPGRDGERPRRVEMAVPAE